MSAHPMEIACDESGFTGGNLTFRHAVFAHASVHVSHAEAAEEMRRLRRRVAAHGELKSSWLLRWCKPDDVRRLLDLDGLLHGGALVHLSDTRLFLLTRLADVLLGARQVSGLDLPGQSRDTREPALVLRRHGEAVFGPPRWHEFLTAAGLALRTNSRWVPPSAVEDFEAAVDGLTTAAAVPRPVLEALRRLRLGTDRIRAIRSDLEDDPRRPPLLEPLLPAVSHAILRWGADHPSLLVVHDEQSALTTWRIAGMERRLARRHPGHGVQLVRVDSRDDPRVQIADLVAGIARRAAAGALAGDGGDDELIELVKPFVDAESVWIDDTWFVDRHAVCRS